VLLVKRILVVSLDRLVDEELMMETLLLAATIMEILEKIIKTIVPGKKWRQLILESTQLVILAIQISWTYTRMAEFLARLGKTSTQKLRWL
jgi:hypothetical protein